MAKKIFGASLITILTLALAIPTLAAVDVSAEGEVTAIDLVAGNFGIQAGLDAYTVIPASCRNGPPRQTMRSMLLPRIHWRIRCPPSTRAGTAP